MLRGQWYWLGFACTTLTGLPDLSSVSTWRLPQASFLDTCPAALPLIPAQFRVQSQNSTLNTDPGSPHVTLPGTLNYQLQMSFSRLGLGSVWPHQSLSNHSSDMCTHPVRNWLSCVFPTFSKAEEFHSPLHPYLRKWVLVFFLLLARVKLLSFPFPSLSHL